MIWFLTSKNWENWIQTKWRIFEHFLNDSLILFQIFEYDT